MANRQKIELLRRFLSSGQAAQRAVDTAIAAAADEAVRKSLVVQPGEWIEIGHVAVKTRSVLEASRVAAKVKTSRQVGRIDGVEFMCLAIFRNVLESQRVAAAALREQLLDDGARG